MALQPDLGKHPACADGPRRSRAPLLQEAWPGKIDALERRPLRAAFPPKLRELFVYGPCRAYLYGIRRIAWAQVADLRLT
jgi:hypothetical protein